MDHGELFAKIDYWSIQRDFWKSDVYEWFEIFSSLIEKGFTFEEASDIVESIIGLTKQEYGD